MTGLRTNAPLTALIRRFWEENNVTTLQAGTLLSGTLHLTVLRTNNQTNPESYKESVEKLRCQNCDVRGSSSFSFGIDKFVCVFWSHQSQTIFSCTRVQARPKAFLRTYTRREHRLHLCGETNSYGMKWYFAEFPWGGYHLIQICPIIGRIATGQTNANIWLLHAEKLCEKDTELDITSFSTGRKLISTKLELKVDSSNRKNCRCTWRGVLLGKKNERCCSLCNWLQKSVLKQADYST